MSYIKQIKIRNFRNLEDATFVIKPLTLLLGPNGSGKSTFLKALFFLEKNLKNDINSEDFQYDISNDIKFGSFSDIITKGEKKKNIEYEFLLNIKDISDAVPEDIFVTVKYIFSNPEENKTELKTELKTNIIRLKKNIAEPEKNIIDNQSGYYFDDGGIFGEKEIDYLDYLFVDLKNKDEDPNHEELINPNYYEEKFVEYQENYPLSYDDFIKTDLYNSKKLELKKDEELYLNGDSNCYIDDEDIFFAKHNTEIIKKKIQFRNNWEKLSSEKKNIFYLKYRNIFFIKSYFSDKINKIIDEFLKIIRVPTVRISLKDFYLLRDRRFNDSDNDEYYGLLKFLEEKQFNSISYKNSEEHLKIIIENFHIINVIKFCFQNDIDLLYLIDLEVVRENLDETVSYIKELITNPDLYSQLGGKFIDTASINTHNDYLIEILENMLNSFRKLNNQEYAYFLKIIYKSIFLKWMLIDHMDEDNSFFQMNKELISKFIDLSVPDFIIKNYFGIDSLSNYWLNLIGFPAAVILEKDKNIGKFSVYDINYEKKTVSNNSYNANYESSGFQQVYPFILFMTYIITTYSHPDYYMGFVTGELMEISAFYIEQPELHLHPALQSKIPLLFSDYLLFGFSISGKLYPNLIVETHSEHIIRKLQIMVAKNEISLGNIAINYLDYDGIKTNVKELRMSENGNFLEPWPNGFFDEAAELSLELMKVQMNRNN